jgi:hypothetical protein
MQKVEGVETFGGCEVYPYSLLKLTPDEAVLATNVCPGQGMDWYHYLFGHLNVHRTVLTAIGTHREKPLFWVSLLAKQQNLRFRLLQSYGGLGSLEHAVQASLLVHRTAEMAGCTTRKPMDPCSAQLLTNALAAPDPIAEMTSYLKMFQ